MPSYDSILLVAHGAPSGNNDSIEYHATRLHELAGVPVYTAYRRYSAKRVRNAMETLADQGYRNVAVVPAFLSKNMYTESIPKAMGLPNGGSEGTYARGGNDLHYKVTTVLGDDPASAKAVADLALSHKGCSVVLVGKHPGSMPETPIEKESMRLIQERGISVAWCPDPVDPEVGRTAMDSLGGGPAVFIPISIGTGVRYQLDGAQMLPPFGAGPWIPDIIKGIVDRECRCGTRS